MSLPANLSQGEHGTESAIVQALETTRLTAEQRQQLAHYLVHEPVAAVYRVNPAYISQKLGWPRRTDLERLGQALRAGVLELNWEVRCPSCGGQGHGFDSLKQSHNKFYCDGCDLHFKAHIDGEVIITINVSQRFRAVDGNTEDQHWRNLDPNLELTTGHELLTLQFYRDFFINEPLPEGESFQVKWMALMFTDLGGSTALYARQGDPRAYSLVREHFNILFNAVATQGGAVVKTIGDAVMAVFPSGALALKAALAAQQAIADFNHRRELNDDDQLRLKIGIHAGPALAVTLNDRLDYFGTVVNAASRVQNHAGYNETLITRQALEDGTADAVLPTLPATETLTLRGLEDMTFEVIRLEFNPEDHLAA